jgi:hypothetical protein
MATKRVSVPSEISSALRDLTVPAIEGLSFNGAPISTFGALLDAYTVIAASATAALAHPLVKIAGDAVVNTVRGAKSGTITVDGGELFATVNTGNRGRGGRRKASAVAAVSTAATASTDAAADDAKGPSLDDLRKKAAELGIDISDLGRKKGLIVARLAQQGSNGSSQYV